MTRLVVLTGGVSSPSSTRMLADRLTGAVEEQLRARGEQPETTVVELRELGSDVMRAMLGGGMRSPALERANTAIAEADAVIAVTPVFSASVSGLFKSFLDVLEPGVLAGTPVLPGATAGTERHSLVIDHAMRPVLAYLGAMVVPTGVFAATSDFGTRGDTGPTGAGGRADGGVSGLEARVRRAAEELVQMVRPVTGAADTSTTGVANQQAGPLPARGRARHADRLAEAEAAEAEGSFTPFEELLGRPT